MAELVGVYHDPFADPMNDDEVRAYFRALLARLHEWRHVPLPYKPTDGTEPYACHENAYRYVMANPGASVCPGWLIDDESSGYTAYAHAVVRQNGELIDITPLPNLRQSERQALRFVPHNGNGDFGFLQERHPIYQC
jgi:hypothetical protein